MPKPSLHLSSTTGEFERVPALFPGEKLLFGSLSYLCGFSVCEGERCACSGKRTPMLVGGPCTILPEIQVRGLLVARPITSRKPVL